MWGRYTTISIKLDHWLKRVWGTEWKHLSWRRRLYSIEEFVSAWKVCQIEWTSFQWMNLWKLNQKINEPRKYPKIRFRWRVPQKGFISKWFAPPHQANSQCTKFLLTFGWRTRTEPDCAWVVHEANWNQEKEERKIGEKHLPLILSVWPSHRRQSQVGDWPAKAITFNGHDTNDMHIRQTSVVQRRSARIEVLYKGWTAKDGTPVGQMKQPDL